MPAYGNSLNPSETTALVRFLTTLRGTTCSRDRCVETSGSFSETIATPRGALAERLLYPMPSAYRDIFAEWSPPIVLSGTLILCGVIYVRGWFAIRKTRQFNFQPGGLSFFAWARYDLGCNCVTSGWICRCAAECPYGGASSADVVCSPLLLLVIRWFRCCRGLPRCEDLHLRSADPYQDASHLGYFLVAPLVAWLAMNLFFLAACARGLRFRLEHNGACGRASVFFWGRRFCFWWPVIRPWPTRQNFAGWYLLLYLVMADIVNTVLSAFLAFCIGQFTATILESQTRSTSRLSRPEGGAVVMWVIGSLIFLVCLLSCLLSGFCNRGNGI